MGELCFNIFYKSNELLKISNYGSIRLKYKKKMKGKIDPKSAVYLVVGTLGIYASYISAGLLN